MRDRTNGSVAETAVRHVIELLTFFDDPTEAVQAFRELVAFVVVCRRCTSDSSRLALVAYREPDFPHLTKTAIAVSTDRLAQRLKTELSVGILASQLDALYGVVGEKVHTAASDNHGAIPPASVARAKNYLIHQLQHLIAEYNLRPVRPTELDALCAKYGCDVTDLQGLPMAACSLYVSPGSRSRTRRRIFVRAGLWEAERTFLRWHELAHWIMHYGATQDDMRRTLRMFDCATKTSTLAAEEEANQIAMVALWPTPALSWLAFAAARVAHGADDEPIQPPDAHLDSTNEKHVELLVRFLVDQYGPIPLSTPDHERVLERVRYFARRRIDAYRRFLASAVFYRSPGERNWFSRIETESDPGRAVLAAIRADRTTIWGIASSDGSFIEGSPRFDDLVGLRLRAGDSIHTVLDDTLALFQWQGRAFTTRVMVQQCLDRMAATTQPFILHVVYRANWSQGADDLRVLCQLQTVPLVASDGTMSASLAFIEPLKVLRVSGSSIEAIGDSLLRQRGYRPYYSSRFAGDEALARRFDLQPLSHDSPDLTTS